MACHKKGHDVSRVLFCGLRGPRARSALRDFNARGGGAAPAPRFCLGQNARTAHSRRGPEGPSGGFPATVLFTPNIHFDCPFPQKGHDVSRVLFCGLRGPRARSALRDFNARGGGAAPAPRFCLGQNARTAHSRREDFSAVERRESNGIFQLVEKPLFRRIRPSVGGGARGGGSPPRVGSNALNALLGKAFSERREDFSAAQRRESNGIFQEEGRSVSGRGLQAQDTHQEQGGEEEPGGGGRFLEQDDAGDQGPQGADPRPDGVGGPQREHLGGLGEKGEADDHPHDGQNGELQIGKSVGKFHAGGPEYLHHPCDA